MSADLQHFRCEQLNCTLTKGACGRRSMLADALHITADGVARDGMAYMVCRGCPIGVQHAKLVQVRPKKIKAVNLGVAGHGRVQ